MGGYYAYLWRFGLFIHCRRIVAGATLACICEIPRLTGTNFEIISGIGPCYQRILDVVVGIPL